MVLVRHLVVSAALLLSIVLGGVGCGSSPSTPKDKMNTGGKMDDKMSTGGKMDDKKDKMDKMDDKK